MRISSIIQLKLSVPADIAQITNLFIGFIVEVTVFSAVQKIFQLIYAFISFHFVTDI